MKRSVQSNLLEKAVEQFIHVVSFTLLRLDEIVGFQQFILAILVLLRKETFWQIERSVLHTNTKCKQRARLKMHGALCYTFSEHLT